MSRLAILGAGGHGKVAAEIAELGGWNEIVFFDDAFPILDQCASWPVAGNMMAMIDALNSFDGYFIAIGDNFARQEKTDSFQIYEAPLVSLIHPAAIVSPRAEVLPGALVVAGAIINVGTQVGRGCIVNTGATIDHDCQLGDFSHVSPGANLGGGVQVGVCSWVGIGSAVRHSVTIGASAIAGAGAVVVGDVADNTVVVGNPARFLRHTKPLNV